MTCEFQNRDDIVMDYIEGGLKPSVRKRFEEHYFVCDECFNALQVMEQALWLMRRRGESIFAESAG